MSPVYWDPVCGSGEPFWDTQMTWNSSAPIFPDCFQKTVLNWVPCVTLLLLCPIEISNIVHSRYRHIPWTILTISKLVFIVTLLILDVIRLVFVTTLYSLHDNMHSLDAFSSVVKIVTLIFTFVLVWVGRRRGITSSGTLVCFWFVFLLADAIIFSSVILTITNEELITRPIEVPIFIIEMIYFPVVATQMCLSLLADASPYYTKVKGETVCLNKEETSSVVSQILYIWYDSLALLGYRRALVNSDLGNLKYENSSAGVVHKFDGALAKVSQSFDEVHENGGHREEAEEFLNATGQDPIKIKPFLMKSILKIFGSHFTSILLLKLASDFVSYTNPLVLNLIILFVSSKEPDWHGYTYASLFALTAIVEAIFAAQFVQSASVLSLKIRTALMSYVYRKALRLSNTAKSGTTVGEIVNLMAVDIAKVMVCVEFISYIISTPIQLVIGMVELYIFLGPSSLVSLALIAVFQGVTIVIATATRRAQVIFMKLKDQRIKVMNEILNGIKVLKLFAWEEPYGKHVEQFRDKEMEQLKKLGVYSSVNVLLWASSSFTISLAVFAVFVLTDDKNILDASKAFVALTIFSLLRRPLMILPNLIAALIEASVSVERLNKFSFCDEIKPEDVQPLHSEEYAIQVKNGKFAWLIDSNPTLSDVSLSVSKGSLVAIVGGVGCGKSSLLSAMLGEMSRISGTVAVAGNIAYGAQIPWIQNCTLKDNVLFGNRMDETRYRRVLKACALLPDLEILPGGDMTEIGEKGINLSGGQKQRVSLARAVYYDADTYLLDDPLSAVDVYVGKHIFENVIGPRGVLRNKTRVLVTHGLTYLPEVDYVVVMKDGTITEVGTYKELINKKGAFAEFIDTYSNNKDNNETEDGSIVDGLTGKPNMERMISIISTSSQRGPADGKGAAMSQSETKGKLVEKEGVETGKVKRGVYISYFKAQGWYTLIFIISLVVSNSLSAGTNLWLSDWSNDPPNPDGSQDIPQRNYRLGIYGVIGFFFIVTFSANLLSLIFGGIKAARSFHSRMLSTVFLAPQWFFDTTPIGRVLNRFSSDVATVDMQLPGFMRMLVNFMGQFVIAVAIIVVEMPWMTLVVGPTIVLFYFIQNFSIASGRQLRRLDSATKSPIYSLFSESINGSTTIRAYKREKSFFGELTAKIDENTSCAYLSLIAQRWLLVRMELFGALLLFSASAFAVIGRANFDPGSIGLIISYTISLTSNLKVLFNAMSVVETNIVSVERVMEYSRLPQEASNGVKKDNVWLTSGAIQFKGYVTKYRQELDTVLKGITCHIRGGEKVGVVGRTGAGKSSLTLALFRIVEAVEGAIFIDGEDISKLVLNDLRKNLTIIPQDPILFSGGLRMNLDPFESSSDEDVWKALELAHLKNFILTLPNKLDHPISEGGENLSVGQRQLVCLARALLKKTKILILDEATAAVDFETDMLIQTTIRQEFTDCTVVTIAHRINTVMDNDRIMVLDKGCIIEFDSPDKLLEDENTVFYGMAKDAGLV